jgi:MinD superfamily P-loop ATPase
MKISVASGKGGTGKTLVSVNLALALAETGNVSFLDCDVEEPNAHVFLRPEIREREPVNLPIPEIDPDLCTYCGHCAEICEYNALAVLKDDVLVFDELCHGCGGCTRLCPESAVREKPSRVGMLEKGAAGNIRFVHGRLDIGRALSPPIIRAVKSALPADGIHLIDAPPGTSCPMVETVKGSDFTLLVTEPTPFGLNDLRLAAAVLKKLAIPHAVVLNRADLGNAPIREFCREAGIPLWMTIPFDRRIAEAYSEGRSLFSVRPEFKKAFLELFERIQGETRISSRKGRAI